MTWNCKTLCSALGDLDSLKKDNAKIELIDDCILVTNNNLGDLKILITVNDTQMIMESVLFAVDKVENVAKMNDEFLRTHKYLPLSMVGIEKINNKDHYVLIGALSSNSTLENIELEIKILSNNLLALSESCSEYFKKNYKKETA